MPATRVLLAPGASGNPRQLAPHVAALEARGHHVELIALPRGSAERAIPVYLAAVADAAATTVIGGQSFGGRVATLIAPEVQPAAVVCFSYPLHAPGRREAWDVRTAHWPRIDCPVLLLSGESDPFADIALLREAVTRLPNATLVTYPGLGHSIAPVLDDAIATVDGFLRAHT